MRCQSLVQRGHTCRHRLQLARRAALTAPTVPRATPHDCLSLPALVFSGLVGEWRLHRRIDSALPSEPSGDVYGTATFTRTDAQATRSFGDVVLANAAASAAATAGLGSGAAHPEEAHSDVATLQAPPLPDDGDLEAVGSCPLFHSPPPAGDLLYGEQGEFRTDSGARFRVRRQYVYGYSSDTDQLDVFFAGAGGSRDYHFHTVLFDADTVEGSGRFLDGLGIGCGGLSVDGPPGYGSFDFPAALPSPGSLGASFGLDAVTARSGGGGGDAATSSFDCETPTGSIDSSGTGIRTGTEPFVSAANNIVPGSFFLPSSSRGGPRPSPSEVVVPLMSDYLSSGEFGDECGGPWWWAVARGQHPCDQDVHLVSYRFEFRGLCLTEWRVSYEVKGPHVDYVTSASYRRPKPARGRRAM